MALFTTDYLEYYLTLVDPMSEASRLQSES